MVDTLISMVLQTCLYWIVSYIIGFAVQSWMAPTVKRSYKSLPPDAFNSAWPRALRVAFKYLPLLAGLTTVMSCYIFGFITDDRLGYFTRTCAMLLFVALFLSAWLQLDWLGALAEHVFPYLTWTGPCNEAIDHENYIDKESGKPLIALSIDDVPATFEKFGPSRLEECLNLLDEHDAKATLFLMARELPKHEEQTQISAVLVDALKRGYEIGNHDLEDVKTIKRGAEDFASALRECDDAIAKLMSSAGRSWRGWKEFADEESNGDEPLPENDDAQAGARKWANAWMACWSLKDTAVLQPKEPLEMSSFKLRRQRSIEYRETYRDPLLLASRQEPIKWFRPGGGFFRERMVRQAARHGYSTALGSCFPFDTHMPAKHNANYLLLRARPGKIIVVHDRPGLLSTLEAVLPQLSEKYKIVTLSGLFQAAAEQSAQQCLKPSVNEPDAQPLGNNKLS